MTDPEARAEKLSRELDSAFRNRADLYRLFLDELTAELGAEKAEAIMIRAIEQRGKGSGGGRLRQLRSQRCTRDW